MNWLLAQETTALSDSTIWGLVWQFANSPVGITLVSGIAIWVIVKVISGRPKWEANFDTYRGMFFDAVRYAERSIPDTTKHKGAQKADLALKYLQKLEGPISKAREADLRKGIQKAVEVDRKIES